MIILGIVLFVIGLVAKIAILQTVGIILAVVGVVLWLLGSPGPGSSCSAKRSLESAHLLLLPTCGPA